MGIFDKIKAGLKRTKDRLGKMLFEIFKAKALDDEFYEDLENALIYADMGITATEAIIEELKEAVYENKIVEPEKAKDELKRIMLESIDYDIPEYEYPLVILVAGVNGVAVLAKHPSKTVIHRRIRAHPVYKQDHSLRHVGRIVAVIDLTCLIV